MSKIEVNQISSQCGSTLTIGQSGDTVTLACGATQTGFGRTGTVDWNTTAITADPANAVSGTGYFANTTSAAFTITLPTSPSAGDIVAVRDYAQTFETNNLTIGRNSQPIDGQTFDLILSTNGQAITLVYVDGTQGWKSVNSNEIVNEQLFVTATGGTVTFCGDYKIHTFTGPGTFTVSCAGNVSGSDSVDYLVVAGGAGGGGTNPGGGPYSSGGGGGAGGFRESCGGASGCYTTSPLSNPCGALPVTVQGYPITVGGGGSASPTASSGGQGNNSVFSTITSTGGGFGTGRGSPTAAGPGGSGGGGSGLGSPITNSNGGSGNTPPVSPAQGNDGGNGSLNYPTNGAQGGGGGGATAAGGGGTFPKGGDGGAGATTSINGTPTAYAGGGGGGVYVCSPAGLSGSGTGGTGGGGPGGPGPGSTSPGNGQAGTANTGGGGGGGSTVGPDATARSGAAGGSGIVIIRYKYQ